MPEEVLESFATSPAAYVVATLLGALLGSFANVCIARIPAGLSIVRPPSHCLACKAPVRWFDNLPLVSYLVLRGRCRSCGAAYSPRYLLVEGAMALLAGFTYHFAVTVHHVADPASLRLARFSIYLLFELVLVVVTFIDIDHKRIPDRITYPGIPAFLGLGLLLGDRPWLDLVLGVAVGYGVVRLISDGYWLLTRREGLGYGDGKLLSLVGGLLGWQGVVFSLFAGSLLGSVLGVGTLLLRRRGQGGDDGSLRHAELPFGPFLAVAALVHLFLQDQLSLGLLDLTFP